MGWEPVFDGEVTFGRQLLEPHNCLRMGCWLKSGNSVHLERVSGSCLSCYDPGATTRQATFAGNVTTKLPRYFSRSIEESKSSPIL
jgi:hypothetical protein